MAHPSPPDGEPGPRAAAILADGHTDIDWLLAHIARSQRAAGRRVRGVVMSRPDGDADGCAAAMVLHDLETGEDYLVSQPLGADSTACRADPQGFARASQVFRRALAEAPDLIVSNRFGGLEADGGGFRAELLEVLVNDIPVLTAVAPRHVEAWLAFTGGAPVLPAQGPAIDAWLVQMLGPFAPGGDAPATVD